MTDDLTIVKRHDWGARAASRKFTLLAVPVGEVIVHHGGVPFHGDGAATMRAVQNYDMDHNGWGDIGYNFAVDTDGVIYEGRGPYIGAHTRGWNARTYGVVAFGDYRTVAVPNAIPLALGRLVGHLRATGAVTADCWVTGHSDRDATACPGGQLYLRLPEIRDRADHYADAPPLPPPPVVAVPPLTRVLVNDAPMLHGGDVADVQRLLVAHGYDPGPVDGWYGPKTAGRVMAFQVAHGLTGDGVVGPATWTALWGA